MSERPESTRASRTMISFVVIAIAALDTFLWNAEMTMPMPYESPYAWALHFPFATIPSAFGFAVCAVLGARASREVGREAAIRATFAIALLAFVSFAIARNALLPLYSRFPGTLWFSAITGVASWVLPLVGIPVALRLALGEVRWRLVPIYVVAFLAVMPFSVATCAYWPGLELRTDAIQAIRLGLPVFWSTVLVSLATAIGTRRSS